MIAIHTITLVSAGVVEIIGATIGELISSCSETSVDLNIRFEEFLKKYIFNWNEINSRRIRK